MIAAKKNDRTLVVLMVKNPVAASVKTRLARDLGRERALRLYRCCVEDLVDSLSTTGIPFEIAYSPGADASALQDWLGTSLRYHQQVGSDLGERLSNAFASCFARGYHRAIALASDVPDVPPRFVSAALTTLKGRDAVVGPCPDGGYYLIGFRSASYTAKAFEGIAWGTESVLRSTVHTLAREGLSVRRLDYWRDIDTIEDLRDFISRNTPDQIGGRTLAYARACVAEHDLPKPTN